METIGKGILAVVIATVITGTCVWFAQLQSERAEPTMPRSPALASDLPAMSCIAFNDDYANARCYSMETGEEVVGYAADKEVAAR